MARECGGDGQRSKQTESRIMSCLCHLGSLVSFMVQLIIAVGCDYPAEQQLPMRGLNGWLFERALCHKRSANENVAVD